MMNKTYKDLKRYISCTPIDIADTMVRLSDIAPHHLILEPSAGKGALIEAINRYTTLQKWKKPANIFTSELNRKNREYLNNNFITNIVNDDCMLISDAIKFHRIIMNPPYKVDISHIIKLFNSNLKPNGILTALIYTSSLFNTTWFSDLNWCATYVGPNQEYTILKIQK